MDDLLIAPWERLAASRAEMASAEGISVRTLQRRLKRQREIVAEQCDFDPNKLPVVPLVRGETDDVLKYRMDVDQLSVLPSGLFRVGDHHGRRLRVQHAGNGKPVEKPAKSKAKFKPKGA